MAGKSTWLRQNALIAAGPGRRLRARRAAEIGAVDQPLQPGRRGGRSGPRALHLHGGDGRDRDDPQSGGPRSLVILDEIGRGTATYDGLSIAWATLEHLHDVNGCRALFATHYHELTALAERLDALQPPLHAGKEWEGEVVFLHEVAPGAADRSYGVQVAKLAGLPDSVVARARESGAVLEALESGDRDRGAARYTRR
jgi:DNA mismatch repair protein MutS